MFGANLKKLRQENNLTQAALAQMLNISQQAVGKWESGRSLPDSNTLVQLAQIFNISLDFLLGIEDFAATRIRPSGDTISHALVPILGTVRAGYGTDANQELLGYEPANVRNPQNYFYLLVQGDSMEPQIKNGDLALVRKQNILENGELGVIVFGNDEGTIKRFRRKGQAVVLQPFNPDYETLILSGNELDNLHIVGKVVETKARW